MGTFLNAIAKKASEVGAKAEAFRKDIVTKLEPLIQDSFSTKATKRPTQKPEPVNNFWRLPCIAVVSAVRPLSESQSSAFVTERHQDKIIAMLQGDAFGVEPVKDMAIYYRSQYQSYKNQGVLLLLAELDGVPFVNIPISVRHEFADMLQVLFGDFMDPIVSEATEDHAQKVDQDEAPSAPGSTVKGDVASERTAKEPSNTQKNWRVCTGCTISKPLNAKHFHRSARSASGFRARCKACCVRKA